MSKKSYDFSGWATKNDLRCSDGRTIRKDAFIGNDGTTVPLVWNHQHNDPMNVLGHAMLENRPEGVYAYCTFNGTSAGNAAREFVSHGDVVALSIYANQLKQVGADVIHGAIREVSLVLAGANPGALIDAVLEHGEEAEDAAIIYTGETLYLSHADDEDEDEPDEEVREEAEDDEDEDVTVADVYKTFTQEQKDAVEALIVLYALDKQANRKGVKHSYDEDEDEDYLSYADDEDDEPSIKEVFDTFNAQQRKAALAVLKAAVEALDEEDAEDEENYEESDEEDEEEDTDMAHNAFENNVNDGMDVLSHSDEVAIFQNARRLGSLREAVNQFTEDTGSELVLQHSVEGGSTSLPDYGMANIGYLFPEYRNVTATPAMIQRPNEWVDKFLGATKHTPFSRLKSILADITMEEARAKGYVTGAKKAEEVFRLLSRTTDPTTVYKKQKIDRDNVQDITSFDVIAWLKGEMKVMLNEELAVAALIGDGRTSGADKINESSIRPIWTDDDLFTIKYRVEVAANATDDQIAKTFIKGAIKARKNYRGTGNPTLYTTDDMLTKCLLMEDLNGRVIYEDEQKLARALRVKEIVVVPSMEGRSREVTVTDGTEERELYGIIVNPNDYTIGADKGGNIGMFDDFDIDYNQMVYLIETRCSGALTVPYSAIAIEGVEASAS